MVCETTSGRRRWWPAYRQIRVLVVLLFTAGIRFVSRTSEDTDGLEGRGQSDDGGLYDCLAISRWDVLTESQPESGNGSDLGSKIIIVRAPSNMGHYLK